MKVVRLAMMEADFKEIDKDQSPSEDSGLSKFERMSVASSQQIIRPGL
jgi:hypothetical protein